MELSRFCSQKLEEAERKITLLMQDSSGRPVEKPFTTENHDPGAD
jgi:exonuclease VII small subunit